MAKRAAAFAKHLTSPRASLRREARQQLSAAHAALNVAVGFCIGDCAKIVHLPTRDITHIHTQAYNVKPVSVTLKASRSLTVQLLALLMSPPKGQYDTSRAVPLNTRALPVCSMLHSLALSIAMLKLTPF